MKKIISLALCLMFVLGCVALPVSAATSSPVGKGIIVYVIGDDKDGTKINGKFTEKTTVDEDMKPTSKDEKVIVQADLKLEGNVDYPLTISADLDGVKTTSKVYALAKDPVTGKVEKIEVKVVADGKIQFVIDKYYSTMSFITEVGTANDVSTSDKTGNATIPAVAITMIAATAAIVLAKKKIEEN